MNPSKNLKDVESIGSEKDWFHLLLEIDRRFRVEGRNNQWGRSRKRRHDRGDSSRRAHSSGHGIFL